MQNGRADLTKVHKPLLESIIADMRRTPSVHRVVFIRGELFAEGSLPQAELRRGKFERSLVSALNRLRKQQKLPPLPFRDFEIEWYAMRTSTMDYRIYPLGVPSRCPIAMATPVRNPRE